MSLCEPTEKERETVVLGGEISWGYGLFKNRQKESKVRGEVQEGHYLNLLI